MRRCVNGSHLPQCHLYFVSGSLAALTSKLRKQPLTSHPSVKGQLEEGAALCIIEILPSVTESDRVETVFDYKEESVVVSNNLITRSA